MTEDSAYLQGFMDKLAEFGKFAKPLYEMTPEEKQKATEAKNKYYDKLYADAPKKKHVYKRPETFKETLKQKWDRLGVNLKSFGRGVASAAGVAGVRAADSLSEVVGWPVTLADRLVLGGVFGIDHGRGLTGRYFNKLHRKADKVVHDIRNWSDKYDQENGVDGGVNRFMNGVMADSIGSFAGYGGFGGLISKGLGGKLLSTGFGGLGVYDAVTGNIEGRQKQLRDREAYMRSVPLQYRVYMDPTSTPWNRENIPTKSEYQQYNLPTSNLPTSHSGTIRIPYNAGHMSNGMPTVFRPYDS